MDSDTLAFANNWITKKMIQDRQFGYRVSTLLQKYEKMKDDVDMYTSLVHFVRIYSLVRLLEIRSKLSISDEMQKFVSIPLSDHRGWSTFSKSDKREVIDSFWTCIKYMSLDRGHSKNLSLDRGRSKNLDRGRLSPEKDQVARSMRFSYENAISLFVDADMMFGQYRHIAFLKTKGIDVDPQLFFSAFVAPSKRRTSPKLADKMSPLNDCSRREPLDTIFKLLECDIEA
jgi:hypothetical protein